MADYGMTITIDGSFDEVKPRVLAALKEQGFGVLTTIDMQAAMREKLGVTMERYEILGACNPPLAHRAVEADRDIGLLLPCNVIVQQINKTHVEVSAVDPVASMQGVENPRLASIAGEVRDLLKQAVEGL